jgi:hypothetical protein
MRPTSPLRFSLVWILCAAAPLAAQTPVPEWLGRRTALVVGTDTYSAPEWTRLASPIRDASAVGETLARDFGFTTTLLRNPSKVELERSILRLKDAATGENDWTVIFIASHGYFDENRNQGYLVTTDSRPRSAEGAVSSYVSLAELLPMVEGFRNRHVLLVLDACYAGTIDRDIATGTSRAASVTSREHRILEQNAARRAQYTSRQFLTSGGKEYVPDGDPGQHSPFAGALLQALRSAAGSGLPLSFDELRGEMAAAAIQPLPRHGVMRGHEPGADFVFVPLSFLSRSSAGGSTTVVPPKPPRSTPVPTGAEIARTWATSVNADEWKKHQSARITFSLHFPSTGVTSRLVTLVKHSPMRVQNTLHTPGAPMAQWGIDGTTVWRMNPVEGTRIVQGIENVIHREEADPETFARSPRTVARSELVERTTLNNQDCYKVRQTWRSGRVTHDCFAVSDGRLVWAEAVADGSPGAATVVSTLADYRDFAGVFRPRVTTLESRGQKWTITIEGWEWDVVTDQELELPAAVRAALRR